MKKLLFAFSLLAAGCMQGPAGEDGKGLEVYTESGILARSELIENHWDITVGYANLRDRVVQVWVRSGSGYMWQTPTWYMGDSYVRIMDDEKVDPQWEYKIVTAGE